MMKDITDSRRINALIHAKLEQEVGRVVDKGLICYLSSFSNLLMKGQIVWKLIHLFFHMSFGPLLEKTILKFLNLFRSKYHFGSHSFIPDPLTLY